MSTQNNAIISYHTNSKNSISLMWPNTHSMINSVCLIASIICTNQNASNEAVAILHLPLRLTGIVIACQKRNYFLSTIHVVAMLALCFNLRISLPFKLVDTPAVINIAAEFANFAYSYSLTARVRTQIAHFFPSRTRTENKYISKLTLPDPKILANAYLILSIPSDKERDLTFITNLHKRFIDNHRKKTINASRPIKNKFLELIEAYDLAYNTIKTELTPSLRKN